MTILSLLFLFNTYSKEFNLPPGLLKALCYVESTHKIDAIHMDDGGSSSLGICQVKLETAKWLGFDGDEIDLMEPNINTYYAAKFLSYQLRRYDGSVEKAVVAYNKGNAKSLLRTEYSDKVLKQWKAGTK